MFAVRVEPVSRKITAQPIQRHPSGQYACTLSVHTREHICSASNIYSRPHMNQLSLHDLFEPTPTLTLLFSDIGAPTICFSIPSPFFLPIDHHTSLSLDTQLKKHSASAV